MLLDLTASPSFQTLQNLQNSLAGLPDHPGQFTFGLLRRLAVLTAGVELVESVEVVQPEFE